MTQRTLIAAICGLIVPMVAASAPTSRSDTASNGSFAVAQAAAGAPTIAWLAPSSGPVGTEVAITGTNFTAENNMVQFSSAARSFDASSPVGSENGTTATARATLLWRDGNSGTVAIWLLNGLQLMQSGSVATVPLNWAIQNANAD